MGVALQRRPRPRQAPAPAVPAPAPQRPQPPAPVERRPVAAKRSTLPKQALAVDEGDSIPERLLSVIAQGDLGKLDAAGKLEYYKRVCASLDLNPLTQPFAFLNLQGKVVLYALKGATEQIAHRQGISIDLAEAQFHEDCILVRATASAGEPALDRNGSGPHRRVERRGAGERDDEGGDQGQPTRSAPVRRPRYARRNGDGDDTGSAAYPIAPGSDGPRMKPHNLDWDRPDAFHDPIGGDSMTDEEEQMHATCARLARKADEQPSPENKRAFWQAFDARQSYYMLKRMNELTQEVTA